GRDTGALAGVDADDGVRRGQGCVCGEAADIVRARRALDGGGGAPSPARGASRHPATFRAALSAGAGVDSRRTPGSTRFGAVQLFSQCYAWLWQSAGPTSSTRPGLRPVARPGAGASL